MFSITEKIKDAVIPEAIREKTERLKYWWNSSGIIGPQLPKVPLVNKLDIVQTHYGNLGYYHAMGSLGESAKAVQKNIIRVTNARVNEFRKYIQENDCPRAYFAIGQAIHYLTDSWTPAHAVRNSGGAISMFQSYNDQDLNKHVLYDNLRISPWSYINAVSSSASLLYDASSFSDLASYFDSSSYYRITPGSKVGVAQGYKRKSFMDYWTDGIK